MSLERRQVASASNRSAHSGSEPAGASGSRPPEIGAGSGHGHRSHARRPALASSGPAGGKSPNVRGSHPVCVCDRGPNPPQRWAASLDAASLSLASISIQRPSPRQVRLAIAAPRDDPFSPDARAISEPDGSVSPPIGTTSHQTGKSGTSSNFSISRPAHHGTRLLHTGRAARFARKRRFVRDANRVLPCHSGTGSGCPAWNRSPSRSKGSNIHGFVGSRAETVVVRSRRSCPEWESLCRAAPSIRRIHRCIGRQASDVDPGLPPVPDEIAERGRPRKNRSSLGRLSYRGDRSGSATGPDSRPERSGWCGAPLPSGRRWPGNPRRRRTGSHPPLPWCARTSRPCHSRRRAPRGTCRRAAHRGP